MLAPAQLSIKSNQVGSSTAVDQAQPSWPAVTMVSNTVSSTALQQMAYCLHHNISLGRWTVVRGLICLAAVSET
jgi:hypothetical protein